MDSFNKCEKFSVIKIPQSYCALMRTVIIDASNELRKGYPECLRVPGWMVNRIQKCGRCEHIGPLHVSDVITLTEWREIAKPIMEMLLERVTKPPREYDHEKYKAYWREYKRKQREEGKGENSNNENKRSG